MAPSMAVAAAMALTLIIALSLATSADALTQASVLNPPNFNLAEGTDSPCEEGFIYVVDVRPPSSPHLLDHFL